MQTERPRIEPSTFLLGGSSSNHGKLVHFSEMSFQLVHVESEFPVASFGLFLIESYGRFGLLLLHLHDGTFHFSSAQNCVAQK